MVFDEKNPTIIAFKKYIQLLLYKIKTLKSYTK